MSQSVLELIAVRRGHFALESGLHGDVWADLEVLFADPAALHPFIQALSRLVSGFSPAVICGPLTGGALVAYGLAQELGLAFCFTERVMEATRSGKPGVVYRLPKSFGELVAGRRVAIVDDAINAGSAVGKTHNALVEAKGQPVVLGALFTVGGAAPKRLVGSYPPIVALEHLESSLWHPEECPLCGSGVPVTDPYEPASTPSRAAAT